MGQRLWRANAPGSATKASGRPPWPTPKAATWTTAQAWGPSSTSGASRLPGSPAPGRSVGAGSAEGGSAGGRIGDA